MPLQPEQILQINVVNWFNYQYPQYEDDLHHFANERKCSMRQGVTLKRMGVKKGVTDIFIGLPCGGYYGLWLELKTEGGKLSKEQKEFIDRKNARGYLALAAWGFDDAVNAIKDYLSLPFNINF